MRYIHGETLLLDSFTSFMRLNTSQYKFNFIEEIRPIFEKIDLFICFMGLVRCSSGFIINNSILLSFPS